MVSSYLAALFLTIVVECAVAALFGYRNAASLRVVAVVNLMTHPALNYLLFINDYMALVGPVAAVVALEAAAVVVEWGLMTLILRNDPRKLFVLSACMNAASFGVGLLIW